MSEPVVETKKDKGGISRYLMYLVGGVGILLLIVFLIGLGFALLAPTQATALRFGMIRDMLLIILILEGILIVIALAALVMQLTRLVAMIQNELNPILKDGQDTVKSAKNSVQFVASNVAGPIIGFKALLAGMLVFFREVFAIRRVTRRSNKGKING
jgi:hypothetical protein